MNKIKNIEKITNVHSSWKPSDIAFVKSLEWTNSDLLMVVYSQSRLNNSGWPNVEADFFEFTVRFKGTRTLRLDFIGVGLQQLAGFDILDISENGLENVNFLIEDYENGRINFYCEEVEIREISLLKRIAIT